MLLACRETGVKFDPPNVNIQGTISSDEHDLSSNTVYSKTVKLYFKHCVMYRVYTKEWCGSNSEHY